MKIIIDAREAGNFSSGKGQYVGWLLKEFKRRKDLEIFCLTRGNLPGLIWYFKVWFWLKFIKKYDIFFSPTSFILPALGIKNTVMTVHDLAYLKTPKTLCFKIWLLERLFLKRAIKKTKAVIAPSCSVKQDLLGNNFF